MYGEATFAASKMIESHDILLIIILMLVSNGHDVGLIIKHPQQCEYYLTIVYITQLIRY